MKKEHSINVRVRYAETDQMGIAYYATYLIWMEIARVEYFRSRGIRYRDMEKQGTFLPVVEVACRYRSPARYDDEVSIVTKIANIGRASIEFEYLFIIEKRQIATGSSKHAFTNEAGKLIPVPEKIMHLVTEKRESEN